MGVLAWITLLPLFGAGLVMLVPRDEEAIHRGLGLLTALVTFAVSLMILPDFDSSQAGFQLEVDKVWIAPLGIRFHLGIDGISLWLVLLTTFLMPVTLLSPQAIGIRNVRVREFIVAMLVLESGMVGAFLSLDLFVFYVFWELMLIPMYFIIGIWGGERRLYAAIKFVIYTLVGSLLMLVAILYLYSQWHAATGSYSFDYTNLSHLTLPIVPQMLCFGAFALAFAIKVPIFPLHTWLPDAHVEAPTAGSVVLASIMLKLGTYGFLRLAVPLFPGAAMDPTVRTIVLALAVIGIVYGALVSLVQPDFKKLVAYSSVSHLGFVMLGIFALTVQSVQGALMVMINHGLSTGALFFLIGMIYERRHTRLIESYGGIARAVPMFATLLTIVSLSSIGVPGTNGFVGEFLVLIGAFRTTPVMTLIATTSVIIAAAYLLWAIQRILFNPLDKPENEHIPDLNRRELLLMAPLMAGIIWLGVYPAPVLRRMEVSAETFVRTVQTRAAQRTALAGQER